MTYGHLQADCLYTGISSGPNARYRVWEAFYLYLFRLRQAIVPLKSLLHCHKWLMPCVLTRLRSGRLRWRWNKFSTLPVSPRSNRHKQTAPNITLQSLRDFINANFSQYESTRCCLKKRSYDDVRVNRVPVVTSKTKR